MSSATYRTLLRAPGAAAFFLTATAGRVGIAMTSLGIVWLVHARTGSYVTAGLVTGGFAIAGCASLLAGWLYGLCQWHASARAQLAAVAAGLAIACLPLLVASTPVELGCSVALTGLAVPLILVQCTVLAEATAPRAVLTQAFAWLGSATAAGSAGAAAVTGWAVGTFGAHGGLAVAATAAALMAVLAGAGLAGAGRRRGA
jgi:hypothetical protein